MNVELNGVKYPYFKEGEGEPCIVVGLASLTVKCLSDNLKNQFCFYGSDLYWSKDDLVSLMHSFLTSSQAVFQMH